jgi:hypothetical protein
MDTTIDFKKMQGLVPAIVQDADSAQVLMLGFMNEQALAGRGMSYGQKARLREIVSGSFPSPPIAIATRSSFKCKWKVKASSAISERARASYKSYQLYRTLTLRSRGCNDEVASGNSEGQPAGGDFTPL